MATEFALGFGLGVGLGGIIILHIYKFFNNK